MRIPGAVDIRMAKPGHEGAREVWHIEEDVDGKYIIFDRARDVTMGDWMAQEAANGWR